MSAPHRLTPSEPADRLVAEADHEVERAAEHYLYWSGKPVTDESRGRASSAIRGLCRGQPVRRDELHVQLVVDELLDGLRHRAQPSASSTSGGGPAFSFARRSSGQSSG